MKSYFCLFIISLLVFSCLPSAENTQTFQRIAADELSARTKLAQIEQQYASCEKRERNFLMQLNLVQAQAYSNYKDAFRLLDQTKVYVAIMQLKESFGNSFKDVLLFDAGKSLVVELSKLESEKDMAEFHLKDISKIKNEYLINYK
jgi:hypothetical protein